MLPIVNGLEAEFGDEVTFLYMDAHDGADGEKAFHQLSLPGHPAILIFPADGGKIFRKLGLVPVETLREALKSAVANT